MSEPVWLNASAVLEFHRIQLERFGGMPGLRDLGMLESALARPQNAFHYGETDVFVLAAQYAWGIARNHPFADGNKRAAFIAAAVFLVRNGIELHAPADDVVETMVALAAGEMDVQPFAAWLRAHVS